jgi:Lrp/AsnC family transcriptional regulator, leucine-responsive regulatory protein
MNLKLDQTDCLILQTLQANAKITNIQLAEHVGLSAASTLERVRKLENQGFIQSYHAKIDKAKLSLQAHLWLQVRLHSLTAANLAMFKEEITHLPDVVACYQIMGEADFLVQIVAKNILAYQDILINQLSSITAIKRIKTYVCLETIKESGLPIKPVLE